MNVARRIRRALRGRSYAELRDRSLQAGRAAAERAGLSREIAHPPEAHWRGEVRDANGRAFADAAALLAEFRARAPKRFFAGTADLDATLAAVRAHDPAAHSRCLELAAHAAAGRLRLLGYPALEFGTPPDWHLEPVRAKRSPQEHWSRVPYLDENVVGDHKVVWELNRHQWLVHLAKAWLFTRDDRWAEQALAHIDAWIDANPRKQGINWASSLEIAFRSIAWLWVLYLLRDAQALTAVRFARIVRVLAVGGRHVERNLSTWFSPNTHLTGEALGLLYLGCALPELRDAARWRRHGMAILAERMPEHVRPDGTYFEQSTHYARYTLDFLVHAVALAQRSGVAVPREVGTALARCALFLRHVSRPDGSIPLIGDDDGGRLLFLDDRAADDVRPSLDAAAAVAGDPALAGGSEPPSEEVGWLLGAGAMRTRAGASALPAGGSRFFADGGFAALRDGWDREASLAVFDCGPHGTGNGGHAHADLGSFDLTLRGRALVVDPGTGSYLNGDGARDLFRGAGAHAAALVDETGSAEPGTPFSWTRAPRVLARIARLAPECDIVALSHDGFLHLPDPVAHRRTLMRVRRDYWLVIDDFRSRFPHHVRLSFPLAAGLRAAVDGARAMIHDARGDVARFHSTLPGSAWSTGEAWTSRAYGKREPALRVFQETTFTGMLRSVTLIEAAEAATPLVLGLEGGAEARLDIERAGGLRDRVTLSESLASLVDAAGHRTEWEQPPMHFAPQNGSAR